MAQLSSLNGVTDTFQRLSKLINFRHTHQKSPKITGLLGKPKPPDREENSVQTTRRLALTLASIVLVGNSGNGVSLAKDNGYWIEDFPLPLPSIDNTIIANEKTGTRSFLKKGIYVANIGVDGSIYRIKKYAFDLMAMADLIGPDTLNYVRKYLRLKSTVMYYDFDKVISAAPADNKQPLIDLANRLFDNFEKLEEASRRKNLSDTESVYKETTPLLEEVMARMA